MFHSYFVRRSGGLFAALVLAVATAGTEAADPRGVPDAGSPAIMVQVKCKPGTADLWLAALEKDIVPAVKDAIAKGDGFTRFTYLDAALPQQYDFTLIYESTSFSGLDTRRPFPHYAALYRRVGPARAQEILSEMTSWEADAKVTIVRVHHP